MDDGERKRRFFELTQRYVALANMLPTELDAEANLAEAALLLAEMRTTQDALDAIMLRSH